MENIEVTLKDFSMIRVNCSSSIAQELSDYFCFFVPGYKFMPAYRRKVWDGRIRLFNRNNGEINAGLFWKIKQFAMNRGYGVALKDSHYGLANDRNKVNHIELLKTISTFENLPFLPRDYQYDAITHAIENKRCVLVSPTGSGKSFIIYLLMRWWIPCHSRVKVKRFFVMPPVVFVILLVLHRATRKCGTIFLWPMVMLRLLCWMNTLKVYIECEPLLKTRTQLN